MISKNMPAADYFARPELSASDLMAFKKSPLLLKMMRDGMVPRTETRAMITGTNLHTGLLEPSRYLSETWQRPTTYTNDKGETKDWNYNANVCKAERATMQERGFTEVSPEDAALIRRLLGTMPSEVREIIDRCESEVSVITASKRCRCDLLDVNAREIWDLKTIRSVDDIERNIAKLSYHLRGEFYERVLWEETGERYYMRLIFCETQAPYRWRIVTLDAGYRMIAADQVSALLNEYYECVDRDQWLDRDPLHMVASAPSWLEIEAERGSEDGE